MSSPRERFGNEGFAESARAAIETSIVIPVYNESDRLPASLPELLDLADAHTELLFVDDGSTDTTPDLLAPAASARNVRVLRQPRNRGKGAALRAGVYSARGRVVAFMDADLSTALESLERLLAALGEADVAIGSRAHEKSILRNTTARRSRLGGRFNRLVRTMTRLDFYDTQCGFKAFRAEAAKALFCLSRIDGFAIDVELLYLAQQYGMRVMEVPVDWTEMSGSKIRPLADPVRMARDVVRTRVLPATRARVPAIIVRTNPEDAATIEGILRRAARVGDLVVGTSERVVVALPGSTLDESTSELVRLQSLVDGADVTCDLVPMRAVVRAWRSAAAADREPAWTHPLAPVDAV